MLKACGLWLKLWKLNYKRPPAGASFDNLGPAGASFDNLGPAGASFFDISSPLARPPFHILWPNARC